MYNDEVNLLSPLSPSMSVTIGIMIIIIVDSHLTITAHHKFHINTKIGV